MTGTIKAEVWRIVAELGKKLQPDIAEQEEVLFVSEMFSVPHSLLTITFG